MMAETSQKASGGGRYHCQSPLQRRSFVSLQQGALYLRGGGVMTPACVAASGTCLLLTEVEENSTKCCKLELHCADGQ